MKKRIDIKGAVTRTLSVGGGAVAGSLAVSFVPLPDAKLKALAVMLVGSLAPSFMGGKKEKSSPITSIADGFVAAGSIALAKELLPADIAAKLGSLTEMYTGPNYITPDPGFAGLTEMYSEPAYTLNGITDEVVADGISYE